jgi:hypothetical protein
MAMNIILWIIFGALAGWIGSMIAGTNRWHHRRHDWWLVGASIWWFWRDRI